MNKLHPTEADRKSDRTRLRIALAHIRDAHTCMVMGNGSKAREILALGAKDICEYLKATDTEAARALDCDGVE